MFQSIWMIHSKDNKNFLPPKKMAQKMVHTKLVFNIMNVIKFRICWGIDKYVDSCMPVDYMQIQTTRYKYMDGWSPGQWKPPLQPSDAHQAMFSLYLIDPSLLCRVFTFSLFVQHFTQFCTKISERISFSALCCMIVLSIWAFIEGEKLEVLHF